MKGIKYEIFCIVFILMVFTGFVGAESYDLVLNGKIGDEIEGYIEIENYYQGPIKVSMFNFDKEYGSKSGKYYSVEFDEEKQFILEVREKKEIGFTIIPKEIGDWEIEIKAYTSPDGWGAGDGRPTYAIVHLIVEAEEIREETEDIVDIETIGEDVDSVETLRIIPLTPQKNSYEEKEKFFSKIIDWFKNLF